MSTAPEVNRCRELGIRSGAISCITNNCCRPEQLTHEHVVETARQASARIAGLVRGLLPELAD
jgi:purine nucleoside phosphorylase